MIELPINFTLPKPWLGGHFNRERIGYLNFLVGPNGSGKSRFAQSLKATLPNSRLLGTDRLSGMGVSATTAIFGDQLASGFQKNWFPQFKSMGIAHGSGLDTFILLEERPDIRIMVEATLSNLFNRSIYIEWDSGNLVPKVTSDKSGDSYRLDRDECHGIRELLVLLTNLYNEEIQYLIIDEPELNLHPQYQSFFMQEVRAIAGDPKEGGRRKGVFLITHSPFMIDLRSHDDLACVISFSSEHTPPVSASGVDGRGEERLRSLIPRLNVHHKQLFFSDNPIFVEGILDAQLVEAIQERRKVSITAAGSCIIDVGGCEEVTKYLELCRALHKSAFFLYDLDSLFLGSLRQCINADGEVASFLADLGLGSDFGKYCGELDRKLGEAVEKIQRSSQENVDLEELRSYISTLEENGRVENKNLARARVAVLIDLKSNRKEAVASEIGPVLAADIEGRLTMICKLLKSKRIFLLPGGALEHYLPSYSGHRYSLSDSAKRKAAEDEILLLALGRFDDSLGERYRDLFDAISHLPAKEPVDTDSVLMAYLSNFVHQLQGAVIAHPDWVKEHLNAHFATLQSGLGKLFKISKFYRSAPLEFSATISILDADRRVVNVTHETNAGMRRFTLERQAVVIDAPQAVTE
ncbi:ATP-dependent nuclease [Burkholderia stabilis]|uniref:ATP-dependent nuclease n=1 Tax=Burkholderia stabilis TaxID=95485 RepID=UPI001588CFB2|nr:AAA family ATPase [Burkholderia stabilis]